MRRNVKSVWLPSRHWKRAGAALLLVAAMGAAGARAQHNGDVGLT